MKPRPATTGFRAFLRRSCRYVFQGVPERVTKVAISQIQWGGLLKGRRVVITGGSKGLGLEFARKCLAEGAKVVITGRSQERLDAAVAELGSKDCFGVENDIRNVSETPGVMAKAEELMGGCPDVLISNAGVSVHEISYATCKESDWDLQVDTNLKGAYFMCQAFANRFAKAKERGKVGDGKILIIASERGLYGDDIPYGLTKAALINFTAGLAKKLILRGIRVNAIAPGVTATEMTGYDAKGNLFRPYARGRRVLLAEEIAETAAFLLSRAANCIAGQVIACNEANHLK